MRIEEINDGFCGRSMCRFIADQRKSHSRMLPEAQACAERMTMETHSRDQEDAR